MKRIGYFIFLGLPLFITLLSYGFPMFLIVLAGFWPTALALVLDGDKGLNMSVCVGYLNFGGICSQEFLLWTKGQSLSAAIDILSTAKAWVVIYGASFTGFIIYIVVPPLIVNILRMWAAQHIHILSETQKGLVAMWGEDLKD